MGLYIKSGVRNNVVNLHIFVFNILSAISTLPAIFKMYFLPKFFFHGSYFSQSLFSTNGFEMSRENSHQVNFDRINSLHLSPLLLALWSVPALNINKKNVIVFIKFYKIKHISHTARQMKRNLSQLEHHFSTGYEQFIAFISSRFFFAVKPKPIINSRHSIEFMFFVFNRQPDTSCFCFALPLSPIYN